jgi:hypothetical protein
MRALLLLVGCFDFAHLSSQYGQTSDGGSADMSVPVSDGASSDGAGAQDLAQGGADLTVPVTIGAIRLSSNSATGMHNSSATAEFYDANAPQPMPQGVSCTEMSAGSCVALSCPISMVDLSPAPGPDMATTAIPPNAGTITVTGTMPSFTLNPGLFGLYTPYSNATVSFFGGGETLTFQASGGTVPAFTQTLLAPNQVQLIVPGGAGQIISRASDFTVMWSGGSGEMQLIVSSLVDAGASIVCNVSASAQSMVIASTLLSQLPAGMAFLGVDTSERKSFAVGQWQIGISASINAVFSGSGGTANANLLLQ